MVFEALAVAGLALSALSAGSAASSNREAKKAAKKLAAYNRAAARTAAVQAIDDAEYEATKLQMRADKMVSHQRVVGMAGNLDMSGGSVVRLQTDTRMLSAIDQYVVQLRGAQKAAGYIMQGDSFSAQAAIDTIRADSATTAAWLNFAGDALGTTGRMYDWYDQHQPPTVTFEDQTYANGGDPSYSPTVQPGTGGEGF